jgi:hypothetical protein
MTEANQVPLVELLAAVPADIRIGVDDGNGWKAGTTWHPVGLLCHEAAAELRRLDQHELANNVWHEKTGWVQNTAQSHELGMHRADVMRQRIERLDAVNAQLLEALEFIADRQDLMFAECSDAEEIIEVARAAIAAAKGEA